MNGEKKKCSGFPSDAKKACPNPVAAVVLRLPVCDEHAKAAEEKGLLVHRAGKK